MSDATDMFDFANGDAKKIEIVRFMVNKKNTDDLIYVLNHGSESVRLAAVDGLVELQSSRGFAVALSNDNSSVRKKALNALEAGNEEYKQVLLGALSNQYADVRLGVVSWLRDTKNIEGLRKASKNNDNTVAEAAIGALSRLGDVAGVVDASNESPVRQIAVVKALGYLKEVGLLITFYRSGNAGVKSEVDMQLQKLLTDGDPRVAREAVKGFDQLGDVDNVRFAQRDRNTNPPAQQEATSILIRRRDLVGLREALESPQSDIRLEGLSGLIQLSDMAAIRTATSNSDPQVRSKALDGLRSINDIDGIRKVLNQRFPELWPIAIDMLSELGDTDGLWNVLTNATLDLAVRLLAIGGIVKLKNSTDAIRVLRAAQTEVNDPTLLGAIQNALLPDKRGWTVWEAGRVAIESLPAIGTLVELIRYLGNFGSVSLVEPIILMLVALSSGFVLFLFTRRTIQAPLQPTPHGSITQQSNSTRTNHRLLIDFTLISGGLLIGIILAIAVVLPKPTQALYVILPIVFLLLVGVAIGASKPGRAFIRRLGAQLGGLVRQPSRTRGILIAFLAVVVVVVIIVFDGSGLAIGIFNIFQTQVRPHNPITEIKIGANAQLRGLVMATDGSIWFTEFAGNEIGTIGSDGKTIHHYPIQVSQSGPYGIVRASDGTLWFTEATASRIGHFADPLHNPNDLVGYPLPSGRDPEAITVGADATIWFIEGGANEIGSISPVGQLTEYQITSSNSDPTDITVGPDGALWFTEKATGTIGRISATGQITEYPINTPDSSPSGITVGPDGALWFTESGSNKIGRITVAGKITDYPIPTANSSPTGIVTGSDHALWFTEFASNKIGRISVTDKISEYPIPTANSKPSSCIAGPNNTIWFIESATGKIGRVALAP